MFSECNGSIPVILFRTKTGIVDITPYIRELLFEHDCVILPGFGGFIGNYTPAKIDKNRWVFYPPVKQITFNKNLNHNDGLLIGRISRSRGLNYGDARAIVEDFVSGLHKRLDKGDEVIFDHIGSFVKKSEGNIVFEPEKGINYHLDSYGFESFQYKPLEGYDVRKRILRHIDREPLRRDSIRKTVWRAAVVLPLLALLLAVPLKTDVFRHKIESGNLNPLVTAEFENNKKAVDRELLNEKINERPVDINHIDETPVSQANPDLKTLNEPVTTPLPDTKPAPPVSELHLNYSVIIGSFQSEENALDQVEILKANGFEPEIIKAPNGFLRVSAIKCRDLETAVFKKDSLLKKYPGTWVSKIK